MIVCVQVYGSKRLSYNAGCQEVSRYHTKDEYEESIAHRLGRIQVRDSFAGKNDCCPPKFLRVKIEIIWKRFRLWAIIRD